MDVSCSTYSRNGVQVARWTRKLTFSSANPVACIEGLVILAYDRSYRAELLAFIEFSTSS
jgi:hypothetical protein